ncbi:putative methyltransferase-domain-containing protein [Umbelopsis sp. PMI_123]|nr:putative methyltransferase-domain-containing protein [Umbelopsis sp. PMI_123]
MSLARLLPSANIVLTDKSDRMKLLQHNVQTNRSTATIASYDWEGQDAAIEEQSWDMVLISDCIWEPTLHTILLQAINRVMNVDTVLMMAYEVRNETVEEQFLDSLRQDYTLQNIPEEEMDEQFQSDDIRIIQAKRLSPNTVYSIDINTTCI